MKTKFLAALLAFLMIVSCFAGCGGKKEANENTPPVTDPEGDNPTDGSQPPLGEDPSVFEGDDWVDNEKPSASAVKTHKKAESIPASMSLIGTDFLPPIGNQGSIGSCASSSIAYCQFSNAVARYLHSLNSKSDFKPATGKSEYLISSKFTMNFAGAGTAWVYDVLKDHGALTRADADFWRNSNGAASAGRKNDPYLESSSWDVEEGELAKALNLRATNYEQIWMTGYNYQLTTTDKGKELVEKIKDAVVTGNVVVTGGFSTYWQYGTIDDDGLGDLGKKGDAAIIYSAESGKPGGHQVSIVGYDDNITYTCAGVTMKGAFQVANSWGDWKNDGYVWLMYDAVNKVSEYPELQTDEVNSYYRPMSFIGDTAQFGMRLSLKELNTDITLIKRGTAEVEGKSYPTYYIKGATGYLTYGSSTTLSVKQRVTNEDGLWAVIPAADISKMPGFSESYLNNSDLKGGYVLYAVNHTKSDRIIYCGAALTGGVTVAYLSSVSRQFYTYNNICLKLEGYDASKNNQTIRIYGNNGIGQELKRIHSMDQFCFLYWDCDIAANDPGYTVTVEVDARNREGFYFELTRKDASGKVTTHVPALFQYGGNFYNVHPDGEYCDDEHYMNFKGEVDGNSCTGYFTLSYASMIEPGADYDNYIWGINICEGSTNLNVNKITLKDAQGNVLQEIIPEAPYNAYGKYVFDLGTEPEAYKNTGSYHLKNAAGQYLTSTNIVLLAPGSKENATVVEITYDALTNEYTLILGDKIYVLDIMGKEIKTGVTVKFNAPSISRNTKTWRVIQNDDGTVTIRLAADPRYAVGIKDGNVCLVAGADIAQYGKWSLENAGSDTDVFSAEQSGKTLTVNCKKPAEGSTFAISVAGADGKAVKTQELSFDATGLASLSLDGLTPGVYVITMHVDGNPSTTLDRLVYTVK